MLDGKKTFLYHQKMESKDVNDVLGEIANLQSKIDICKVIVHKKIGFDLLK